MKYVRQFDPAHSGQFSSIMTDRQYMASRPAAIMQLPPQFAKAPHALPKNWRDIANKQGWPWVLFSSGTVEEARLILFVPGDHYDRTYVYASLFNPDNSDPTTYDVVQMQAVEKNPMGRRDLYFSAWDFKDTSGVPRAIVPEARCLRCHLNGPRAIVVPDLPHFATEIGGVHSVNELNQRIVSPQPLNYARYYDMENFPTHMDLGSGHQCTECHNENQRHSLAFSIDRNGKFNFSNVMRKVSVEKTMPMQPSWEWTDLERMSTSVEIENEYRNKLKVWLTERKCNSN